MGWFRRLLRMEERAVSFQDFWGSGGVTPQLRAASVDTALTLVPVFAATRLLADSVASLPLQAFRQAGDSRIQIPDPALFRDPTEFGTVYDWLHRAMTSITLRGNAYGLITSFEPNGFPRRIEWLHPDEVSVVDNRTQVRPVWLWRGRQVDSEAFVHIPGYTLPGQILGLSPIAAYALTIETGILSQRFGRDWFQAGSVPAGVLETDKAVSREDAHILKERFKAAASGRDVVALGLGTKYHPITVPPEESQFLATMKATTNQIASIYGLPPEMIGGESGGPLTYNTPELNSIALVRYALRPYLVRFEAALTRLLPRPQYAKFNVDAITRADLKTRYEAHHIALTDGWKSKDEVRALEDLPPLPDGQGTGFAPTMAAPARTPATEEQPPPPVRSAGGELNGHREKELTT